MESTTYLRNIRISPKKLRFILPEVKKLAPQVALDFLNYTPKKGAKILYKAIKSAIYNAKSHLKVDENMLQFHLLSVEQGQTLKRFRSAGRGSVRSIKKRFSHIRIVLKAKKIEEKKLEDKKQIKKTLNPKYETRNTKQIRISKPK